MTSAQDPPPEDCNHVWADDYYGIKCVKCGQFYPYGSEPWMPLEEI